MKLTGKIALVLACLLASGTAAWYQAESAPTMTMTANWFLSSLTPEQREMAMFEFGDEERMNWHFIPRERKGLSIKDMQPHQLQMAQALLASGLSQQGMIKATTIMSLEKVLYDLENGRAMRDPELYFVSIFGTPSEDGTWGWRYEGHHLALNFTVDNGKVVATPAFFGANPAEVRAGMRAGTRPLGPEEDLARKLVDSFNADQLRTVMIADEAPRDIITGADRKANPGAPAGLAASRMTDAQKEMLRELIGEYVHNHAPDLAHAAMEEIRAGGIDAIHFAWAGSRDKGKGHYYRVQGPAFLMEYDNIQNDANHIHSVWRDLRNDFGTDLLARHYREFHLADD